MCWIESCEQVYRLCSACTTPGRLAAYSATAGTSRKPPMLDPQWQTKTPMRGSSALTSRSGGYATSRVQVQRAGATIAPAAAAAPLASTTDSGMSFGSRNGPTAKIPGRLVCSGWKGSVRQNPCSSSSTPSRRPNSRTPSAISIPTESTTKSNSSSTIGELRVANGESPSSLSLIR